MAEIMEFVRQNLIWSMAWLALLVAVVYLTVKGVVSKVKVVNHTEVIRLMNQEEAVVIDIRSQDQYRSGHILNAQHILPSDVEKNNLTKLEKHKAHPVIVACVSGITASKVAGQLSKLGFEKVYVLKEGMSGWSSEKLPVVQGKGK